MKLKLDDEEDRLPRGIDAATVARAVYGAIAYAYEAIALTKGFITKTLLADMNVLEKAAAHADDIAANPHLFNLHGTCGSDGQIGNLMAPELLGESAPLMII
jgi:hypothetical protein